MIGQTLSHFRITAKLGEGGMGEVYRAEDTRLGREVAIKVLPEALTVDPERLARFEREAQLLASLSHPNIGAIHGLEEVAGERFLVLELIEGEDLAERLARGPVPLEEAVRQALQIAQALEAAHDKGIVHRDLKPANIKITPEGQVKVLDFGLAKAVEDEPGSQDIHNSPTLTAAATQAGIILGTAAYMAPEQAAGEAADRRADIWSFGVVFSEMLTGRQRFQGQTVSHVLAAVLKDDPDWTDFPPGVPETILDLLERCLRKDRSMRLQAMGDVRVRLQEYLDDPEAARVAVATQGDARSARRAVAPWSVAALMALGLALALWRPWAESPPLPAPMRLTAAIGADATLGTLRGAAVVISADGQRLAFVGEVDGTEHLFVRPLDQATATRLPGTDGARKPFFSPDGEWIGFFDASHLKKVAFRGGAVVTLARAQGGRGGAWSDDGRIAFSVDNRSPLRWISEAGGQSHDLTVFDRERGDFSHRYPQFLPGGLLLYTAHGGAAQFEDGRVVIEDLEQGRSAVVADGAMYGRYLASGHLAYVHDGVVYVAPIDLDRLEIVAAPVPAVEDVSSNPVRGTAQYDVSRTGILVHQSGTAEANLSTVKSHSADGTTASLIDETGVYYDIHFSPDGRRLALEVSQGGGSEDIWVYELERGVMTRLTFDEHRDEDPVWTPDGSRIAFNSDRHGGPPNIYWKPADGTGATERLLESGNSQSPYSWSPDGRTLAYMEWHPETTSDIWTVTVDGDAETGWVIGMPQPFLTERTGEFHPSFSPDGRWIAYTSLESGEPQVYVRPFPGPGGKWQVSIEGGGVPIWSPDGRTLYYRSGSKIMSVEYEASATAFRSSRPTLWREVDFTASALGRVFSWHPDGWMAVVTPKENDSPEERRSVNFIFNFFTELEHIAPTRPQR